ncbi:MAG: hypothetical protein ACRDKX_04495, partial [Solirubrobacterales bacterium]
MRRAPPLLIAATAAGLGALVTLAIGLAALDPTDVEHLAAPLGVAVVLTVAVTGIAARTLGRASLRLRFVAIAAFASLIGLVNLGVLSALMAVSEKDAVMLAILLAYAAAAAIGAALAVARSS